MSHPPTYALLPHFHKIEACTSPLTSEQADGYNTATREDRPGRTRPGLTSPGRSAADPSGSSFYLPSSSLHKDYFRKLFTNSFKIFETPFENAVKQMYVKEPETQGTILNFPCRIGKPSLTEFFPT